MRRVLKTVAARLGATITAAGGEVSMDDLALIATLWSEQVDEDLLPFIRTMFNTGAFAAGDALPEAVAAQINAVGVGALTGYVGRRSEEFLANARNRLTGFSDHAWEKVRDELVAGLRSDEGIDKLSKRLTDAFDILESRANTIVRTEVMDAVNSGALAEMRALGDFGPAAKTWLAELDDATDEECADLDGETVAIDAEFSSGDDSPPIHANCRCTLTYGDLPEEASPDGAPAEAAAVEESAITEDLAASAEEAPVWDIVENHADCDGATPWGVVDSQTGELDGCFASEEDAQARVDELVAAAPPDSSLAAIAEKFATVVAPEASSAGQPGAFHSLMVIEGVETGDGRIFAEGSLEWRNLPIPLKWQIDEQPMHDGSMLVGRIDRIERQGSEVHGWGVLDVGGSVGAECARLIEANFLRGVSVDVDDVGDKDVELVWPSDPQGTEDGPLMMENPEKTIFHHGRIAGATCTPMPAFQEAFIELIDVTPETGAPPEVVPEAASVVTAAGHTITLADVPPAWWFDEPTDVPAHGALTITDEGRIYGFLAPSGVGHLNPAYSGRTVPMGNVSYDTFHRGEAFVCDDDGQIRRIVAGNITMGCGHAPLTASNRDDHYDNSCSLVAKVRVGENMQGVWVAGALLPDVDAEQIERMMVMQLSGDWRAVNSRPELVAALLVPVPGFAMARKGPSVRVRTDDSGVATMVASAVPVRFGDGTRPFKPGGLVPMADRLARGLGRDRTSRAAALAARVKGA